MSVQEFVPFLHPVDLVVVDSLTLAVVQVAENTGRYGIKEIFDLPLGPF